MWVGASKKEIDDFPDEVQQVMGYALWRAQEGKKHPDAKPLKGFGGAGVLEIIADEDGDTYRTIYTVRLKHAVYVLHAFQKKSRRGIKTPDAVMDMVQRRLRDAEMLDAQRASMEGRS